jgi:hypothetical protein
MLLQEVIFPSRVFGDVGEVGLCAYLDIPLQFVTA